jgi:hypothetical protein
MKKIQENACYSFFLFELCNPIKLKGNTTFSSWNEKTQDKDNAFLSTSDNAMVTDSA